MGPDDRVAHGVTLPQLDLDSLAQGREHLGEDDLLVPYWSVGVLLHRGSTLWKIKSFLEDFILKFSFLFSGKVSISRTN